MEDITLPVAEVRALLNTIRILQMNSEAVVEAQSSFFEAFPRSTAAVGSLVREHKARAKRGDDIVKRIFAVLRTDGTDELKTAVGADLKEHIRPVQGYFEDDEQVDAMNSALMHAERRMKSAGLMTRPVQDEMELSVSQVETRLRAVMNSSASGSTIRGLSTRKPVLKSIGSSEKPLSPKSLLAGSGNKVVLVSAGKSESTLDSDLDSSLTTPVSSKNVLQRAKSDVTYDSDIDGSSSENAGEQVPKRILNSLSLETSGTFESGSPNGRPRLQKTKGLRELVEHKGSANPPAPKPEESVVSPVKGRVLESPVSSPVPRKAFSPRADSKLGELLSGLWRRDGDSDEEEEAEIQIGSPQDVQHVNHIGPGTPMTMEDIQKMAQSALGKQKATVASQSGEETGSISETETKPTPVPTPAAAAKESTSMRLFAPKKGSEASSKKSSSKAKDNDESDDDDGGFVISGPTNVEHQAHADREDEVVDQIDNVILKTRPVEEDVFVETKLEFAEEYNPNL